MLIVIKEKVRQVLDESKTMKELRLMGRELILKSDEDKPENRSDRSHDRGYTNKRETKA